MKIFLSCLLLSVLTCGVRNSFAEDSSLTIGPRRDPSMAADQRQRESAERIQAHVREQYKRLGESAYIGASWILEDANHILVTGYGHRIERQYYGQRVRVDCRGIGANGMNTEVITITDLKTGQVLQTMKFEDKIRN